MLLKLTKKILRKGFCAFIIVLMFLTTMVGCSNDKQKNLSHPSNGSNSSSLSSDLHYFTFKKIDGGYSIALNSMPELSTTLSIPNSYQNEPVLEIENDGFRNFNKITEVTLPNSLLKIGDSAFYNCSSLTRIEIPAYVTRIGWNAFYNCSHLQSVTFAPNSQIESIEYGTFYGCNSLTNIEIPSRVKTIGWVAFYNCTQLQSVTFESNSQLESIENFAFYSCSLLKRMEMPMGVTSIGNSTFYNCNSLISIVIPRGVISMGPGVFSSCHSLTIYCEIASQPSDWNGDWNSSGRPVYWSGQWSYVEGIPTPNN